ncbi:MAG: DNA polymerase I, partial [Alphaproteobacteria bacterium]|nr:DNA polymerase I [Alphaproteobacteria bacterium]
MLTLIDGSGFIFRAFHALPPMTRSDGTHVNAVYGYCNMLNKLIATGQIDHNPIAVIFDAGRKTFRNEIYKQYKAHRPEPPPELVPQFALIREATRAYGLPAVELANYEADDLIAAYAKEAHKKGIPVRIISSDKDLMQLIRDGVEMQDPIKTTMVGEEDVFKKFGVTPDKVVEVQALAGDSIDNVPGVPGIGVKTAAELINHYGSLEKLLADAENIKQPKRRQALIENAELARISRRLVQLDDNAPMPVPLKELQRRENKKDLIEFLQAQEFKSLLAKLGAPMHTPMPQEPVADIKPNEPEQHLVDVKTQYELVQTEERLQWWADAACARGILALDTETDSLTACTAKLVGVSLAIEPGKACYIPIGHVDPQSSGDGGLALGGDAPEQISVKSLVKILRDVLRDPSVLKIAHNLKYDAQVLGQHGLVVEPYDDTMLLSFALAAGSHGHGLDELAMLHFKHKMIAYADVTGTGKNKITFDRVALDKAVDYAAEDADFTL